MAGAGYKLFNTGDVLTAAQVNTYLMEQTVMVFANATARTTALSGVVSEGMISYLKDTNAVEVYDGSNWVSSDDPNAIQNTIVDAKGDLIAASAADTPARLAVGNNGETLVADSSATTGLRWSSQFLAGKNKIINGDFGIWQRGTSFTNAANGAFTADRWVLSRDGTNTTNVTQQTFTPGTAPVAGYEGQYFLRASITSTGTLGYLQMLQRIEDVRSFAGQTITVSFWAKGSSNATGLVYVYQDFGSGGSAGVETGYPTYSLTTSWQRFSVQITVPSISGKTVGTGSHLVVFIRSGLTANGANFDLWGVQVEAGSVATPFSTATGTLAGELAACQRYYVRQGGQSLYQRLANGAFQSSTTAYIQFPHPVTMRVAPTSVDFSTMALNDYNSTIAATNITIDFAGGSMTSLAVTVASGGTQYRPVQLLTNNSTSAYVGLSAEL